MKAGVKYFHSPDIEDLKNFKPKEEDSFGFLLQIIIGEKGKKWEESLDIEVCTPDLVTTKF